MSFNEEEEDNNPFSSGIEGNEVFDDLPLEDEDNELKDNILNNSTLLPADESTALQPNNQTSYKFDTTKASGKSPIFENSHNIRKLYSQRIEDTLVKNPNAKDTEVSIIEAANSNENDHPATSRSYVIYTIKIANDIIVKRRYSDFENLRNILVKLFPLSIIPPIPEKQSVTSNFSLTGVPQSALKTATSAGSASISNGEVSPGSNSDSSTSYIQYRKRLLRSFIEKCIILDHIRENFVFLTFLDPHPNFNEFIHVDVVGKINQTSIYKLSPVDPLASLEDELYLNLPVPSEHSSLAFHPKENEKNKKHLTEYAAFEEKFKEYESILSNLAKYNRNIIKSTTDLATDYSELGSHFNSLSLEQESSSHIIERLGQSFDSSFFDINQFKNLINLKFLENVIELKSHIKAVRNLIVYNKRKWLQSVEVLRLIDHNTSILEELEKLESQSKIIDDALSKSRVLNPKSKVQNETGQDGIDELTDEQKLIAQMPQIAEQGLTPSNKLFGYKIPGLKKLNKAILSITDPNPGQTRKQEIVKTKLKLIQLKKQYELVTKDNELIDQTVVSELRNFQDFLKLELCRLCYHYSKDMKEFLIKSSESWEIA